MQIKKLTPKDFLTQLKAHDTEKYKIVSTLRDLILKDKKTSEEIKYSGLLYSQEKPYAGLFVSKNHVSMEFSEGASFDDPKSALEGAGKHRRHLKFSDVDEITSSQIRGFLKQARSLT